MTRERRRSARAPAIGIAGGLLVCTPAWAASPEADPEADLRAEPSAEPTPDSELVLIRVVPGERGVAARLRAELDVIGLDTEMLDIDEQAPTLGPDLLDRLELAGASAAIEISIGETRIDVWVADGTTGKTLNRRFDLAIDPNQAEPRTLAIAAVELLRASRLEISQDAGERDSEQRSADQQSEDERPPGEREPFPGFPLRGALSLAPVLGGSPGGLGVSTHIDIAGRWAPLERFALRVSLWVPTLGNTAAGTQGEARIVTMMAFVEPQLRLPGGARWFHPELGLGLGGAVTIIQAQPGEGFARKDTTLGGFAGHVHLGLGFEVARRVWIRLDGFAGIVQPQPRVLFVDEIAAEWGLPYGAGSLGIELWF